MRIKYLSIYTFFKIFFPYYFKNTWLRIPNKIKTVSEWNFLKYPQKVKNPTLYWSYKNKE